MGRDKVKSDIRKAATDIGYFMGKQTEGVHRYADKRLKITIARDTVIVYPAASPKTEIYRSEYAHVKLFKPGPWIVYIVRLGEIALKQKRANEMTSEIESDLRVLQDTAPVAY